MYGLVKASKMHFLPVEIISTGGVYGLVKASRLSSRREAGYFKILFGLGLSLRPLKTESSSRDPMFSH